jgi:hypothetical protein
VSGGGMRQQVIILIIYLRRQSKSDCHFDRKIDLRQADGHVTAPIRGARTPPVGG